MSLVMRQLRSSQVAQCIRCLHTPSKAKATNHKVIKKARQPSPTPPHTRAQQPTSRPPRTPTQPPAEDRTQHDAASKAGYDTVDAIYRKRRIPLLAAGVVALGCGIYFTMIISSFVRDSHGGSEEDVPTGRPPTFTRESAQHFDRTLDASEKSMGITALRHELGRRASGHVLEVALGTGRNMKHYNWACLEVPATVKATATPSLNPTQQSSSRPRGKAPPVADIASFTGIDVSADMLGVAIDKLPETVPALAGIAPTVQKETSPWTTRSWGLFSYLGGRFRIAQCDIQDELPPPSQAVTKDSQYDTVIQTFGLCSVADPERVVRNLATLVKPETGRIILLEHGRGGWNFVNALLDWSALSHFNKYGCWWNRDIVRIVRDAAESVPGLKVLDVRRPYITQLGTTVWLELMVEPQQ